MKKVIKEIIDIEHKAKDIISLTNEEIAKNKTEIEQKLEELHDKLIKESKEKIKFLKERDTKTSVDDVGDDYEAHLKEMDEQIESNLDTWSDYLYEVVIGKRDE